MAALGLAVVTAVVVFFVFRPEFPSAAGQPSGERPEPPETESSVKTTGTLYFVIDDAGHNLRQLEPFLRFPGKLTIAVIPHLAYSRQSAELAYAAGKQVILHMPMQPEGDEDPGTGAILSSDSEASIREKLGASLAAVPYAVGVNNHMGSHATSDPRVMAVVLQEVYGRGLFFLDSLTTSRTAAGSVGQAMNLNIRERDVFLDNEKTPESLLKAIEEGKTIARQKGHAVMIGHVWTSELAEVLTEIYPFLLEEGYTLEEISHLIKGE